jgi:hypothetical protein
MKDIVPKKSFIEEDKKRDRMEIHLRGNRRVVWGKAGVGPVSLLKIVMLHTPILFSSTV